MIFQKLFIIIFNLFLMWNIACEVEKLGKGCSNRCSGHCVENVPCNSTTGHCDRGCASGYVEPFCNKSMNVINFINNALHLRIEKQNQ